MAEVHVQFDWIGSEPEVREAMRVCDRYDFEDLSVEQMTDFFGELSLILRRGVRERPMGARRTPLPGMGRLAEEAVSRRLQCVEKVSQPVVFERMFD